MIIPFAQAVGALFGMLGTQSYIDDIGPPMLPLGFIAFSAKGKFPLFVQLELRQSKLMHFQSSWKNFDEVLKILTNKQKYKNYYEV